MRCADGWYRRDFRLILETVTVETRGTPAQRTPAQRTLAHQQSSTVDDGDDGQFFNGSRVDVFEFGQISFK